MQSDFDQNFLPIYIPTTIWSNLIFRPCTLNHLSPSFQDISHNILKQFSSNKTTIISNQKKSQQKLNVVST